MDIGSSTVSENLNHSELPCEERFLEQLIELVAVGTLFLQDSFRPRDVFV